MISRTTKASVLQGFIKSRSMLAGNAKYGPYWVGIWSGASTTGAGVVTDSSNNPVTSIGTSYSNSIVSVTPTYAVNNFAKTATFVEYMPNRRMCKDTSGNYYVVGQTYSGTRSYDGFILKYNSSGVLQYAVRVDGVALADNGFIRSVTYDSVGGYLWVCGQYIYSGANQQFICRLTASTGAVQATKVYRTTSGSDEFAFGIITDSSGNIFVSGYSYGFSGSKYEITTLKFDSSFSLAWQRKFVPATNVYPYSYQPAVDSSGNYYGCASYVFGSYYQQFIYSYDTSGTLLWQRYLVTTTTGDYPYGGLIKDPSANFVYMAGGDDTGALLLSKWDLSGNLQWVRKLTASAGSNMDPVQITIDGSLMYISGLASASGKAYLIKLPTDGSGTGVFTMPDSTYYTYAVDTRTAVASSITSQTQVYTATAITATTSAWTGSTVTNSTDTFSIGAN